MIALLDVAARLDDPQRERFEHQREAGVLSSPRNADGPDPAVTAVGAGRGRHQLRLELHRVQLSPTPLRRTVNYRTLAPTLRAPNRHTVGVLQADGDPAPFKIQIDVGYFPGALEPEQLRVVMAKVFHHDSSQSHQRISSQFRLQTH